MAGLRLAVVEDFGGRAVSGSVRAVFANAVDTLASLGARTTPTTMSLPDPMDYFLAFWAPAFTDTLDELRRLDDWSDDRVHPTMIAVATAAAA